MSERDLARRDTMTPQAPESDELVSDEAIREFLAFALAQESYALPLPSVREIVKLPHITEVPRAPRDVLGIISVRGRVTTVVDLRRRLRVEASPFDRSTRILLVDTGEEIMGLLVDKVLQVFRLRTEEIEVASIVGSDTAEYVSGIGRPQSGRSMGRYREDATGLEHKGDILILLDPRALLKR